MSVKIQTLLRFIVVPAHLGERGEDGHPCLPACEAQGFPLFAGE